VAEEQGIWEPIVWSQTSLYTSRDRGEAHSTGGRGKFSEHAANRHEGINGTHDRLKGRSLYETEHCCGQF